MAPVKTAAAVDSRALSPTPLTVAARMPRSPDWGVPRHLVAAELRLGALPLLPAARDPAEGDAQALRRPPSGEVLLRGKSPQRPRRFHSGEAARRTRAHKRCYGAAQVPKNMKLLAVPMFELFDNVNVRDPSARCRAVVEDAACAPAALICHARPELTACTGHVCLSQRYGHEIAALPQCLSRYHFDMHAPPDSEN